MIVLVGNKSRFAIEVEILDIVDGWIFGTFYFWIQGNIVGNPSDKSVDLKGCINWLRDFVENPRNRFEPSLYELNREQAFVQLTASVLSSQTAKLSQNELYEDTYSRFHISHLGMSSFDIVTLLLIKNKSGQERCIWQMDNEPVNDAYLDVREMERVSVELLANWRGLAKA